MLSVEVKPVGADVHEYVYVPEPPDAVAKSWVVSPSQIVVSVAETATESAPPVTVTSTLALAVQPAALVTVTVYVVLLAGDTVMLAVVAPVLHT